MPGAYRFAPAVAIVSLLFLFGASIAEAEQPPIREGVNPDTVTATVRYVHPGERGFEVIAGVQYALRLDYFRVTEETVIMRDAETVALEDIEPGDLIRVDYSETDAGKIAISIHVIGDEEEGGLR